MTTAAALKQSICDAIDRNADKIIEIGETIRRHPELGFKEVKTARLVEETLGGLGLTPKGGLAITGVRAEARGPRTGRPSHCSASWTASWWPGTPGRSANRRRPCVRPQCAGGGLARGGHGPGGGQGLRAPGRRVVFFAVPAEEYGDVEWRVQQARAGRLEFSAASPSCSVWALRRRGPRHDDPHHVPAGDEEGGRVGLEQRLHREDGSVHRPRLPRGGGAPSRHQRALRRQYRPGRDQCHPRDVPRRGHHPRPSHHHARRQPGERDPGRGPARDLRARQDGTPARRQYR